jgi:integrase/recombinase XerD
MADKIKYDPNNAPEWMRKLMRAMTLRHFAIKTQKSYIYGMKRYIKHTGKDPMNSNLEDILSYQEEIIRENIVSYSTYRVNCCVLRFFYDKAHPQEWSVDKIPFPKKLTRLPVALSQLEVMIVINLIAHSMIKAAVQLMYATGMRINEAISLKVSDIDGQRSRIRIIQGKGGVDREVPLSDTVRIILREVYSARKYSTSQYLFVSTRIDEPIHESLLRKHLKQAVIKSNIQKHITSHTFRHSFATQHLEDGMNIRQLQKLLGHKSVNTTFKYVHMIEEKWSNTTCLLKKAMIMWDEYNKISEPNDKDPKKDSGNNGDDHKGAPS